MAAMTVRSRIEKHLSSLSVSERRIARLVIEKYPVSALGGIEDLARQSTVSAPTVTRFVRRLGFDRFTDFQRAVRLEMQEDEASPLALLRKHRSARPVAGTHDGALMADLARSLSLLPTPAAGLALDAAALLLADGRRRVSIIGGRWSSIAAQYLAYQLSSLRGEVHTLLPQASGVREDRIADFGKRDLLVAYDFRRYQPETIAFCEASRRRRVRIVLITDPELSPICEVADVTIPVPVATISPLDTLVPAIAATDALLARLVASLGAQATQRMAMLESLRRAGSEAEPA